MSHMHMLLDSVVCAYVSSLVGSPFPFFFDVLERHVKKSTMSSFEPVVRPRRGGNKLNETGRNDDRSFRVTLVESRNLIGFTRRLFVHLEQKSIYNEPQSNHRRRYNRRGWNIQRKERKVVWGGTEPKEFISRKKRNRTRD